MGQHVWRIGKLAWMRRDCIPYSGKIEGWTRLTGRLFWCSGYSREWEIRCAYRQGWADGNVHQHVRDIGRIVEEADRSAEHYLSAISGRL